MPSLWDVYYESPDGDTSDSTQPLLSMRWRSLAVTFRRRAPHTITIVADGEFHRLTDFVAAREFTIHRNGTLWLSGFMDAPSLPGGEDDGLITLAGWGNAYALILDGRTSIGSTTNIDSLGLDSDGIIASRLATIEHGSGGDWFPLGGNVLEDGPTNYARITWSGKSGLEIINTLCDLEGWSWRTTAAYSFQAGSTVDVDQSATLKFFSPANCRIVSYDADATRLATRVLVAARRPNLSGSLDANASAGQPAIVLDDANGWFAGDVVWVGTSTANEEAKTILSISGNTITFTANLTNAHSQGARVTMSTAATFATSTTTDDSTAAAAHHTQTMAVYDDQMRDPVARAAYAETLKATYSHVLEQARVVTSDQSLIDACLTAGLHPGDLVSLTSGGRLLADVYDNTSVSVQEMTLAVEHGQLATLTLTLGDPMLDALGVLETRMKASHAAATAVRA